ncbi:MAG: hypothetical protein LBQ24_07075 [Candidatus Peribacteria bacterium]|jgi:hypothetical protein|nr:hypothetical protein [Candidatus Peribacteria bacterium]
MSDPLRQKRVGRFYEKEFLSYITFTILKKGSIIAIIIVQTIHQTIIITIGSTAD